MRHGFPTPMALLAVAMLFLSTAPAMANPRPAPTPTPSPTPATLPIGGVQVRVGSPGSAPTGASHVERPRFR